ncbi:ESX-1 secretion system eccCa1 domain protein [Mycobacterium kansasii]|uniref:ESX-1 secretion system eccCa1 domain protein n=1 Tax=Mycobacterium kansasii TaxID=1768 RepID=A0A1V3XBG5_MYCKA|nr:ESX-1 secretion system eccCa1 domain protein [Mycobacterium kansasii]
MTTKKFTPTITRGPRLTPGEISLTPPDDLGIDIPPSGVQKVLPYVMGGAMLGMIAIMFAGGRQLSPYMLMMPLMMIVMMVGSLAGGSGGGGKKVPEINADRKEYLRYLAGLRGRVTSSATSQVAFFGYHARIPTICCRSSAPSGSGRGRRTATSTRPPGSASATSRRWIDC